MGSRKDAKVCQRSSIPMYNISLNTDSMCSPQWTTRHQHESSTKATWLSVKKVEPSILQVVQMVNLSRKPTDGNPLTRLSCNQIVISSDDISFTPKFQTDIIIK